MVEVEQLMASEIIRFSEKLTAEKIIASMVATLRLDGKGEGVPKEQMGLEQDKAELFKPTTEAV